MPPALQGVGIGLRREFHDAILTTSRRIDWLEIVSENFLELEGRPRHVLERCLERWPVIPHGVAASLGTGRDDAYDDALAALVEHTRAPFFSDHLCYSNLGGAESFDLLPLPFTDEAVHVAASRARRLAAHVGRPMILENITYYAEMPGSRLTESAFVNGVLRDSGCGLLLDLGNLYLNAMNHGADPDAALARVPLERVTQIHLAGFTAEGDVLLDTHASAIAAPVWDLYRTVIARVGAVPTLIEWDQRIPSLDAVLDEADKARDFMLAVAA